MTRSSGVGRSLLAGLAVASVLAAGLVGAGAAGADTTPAVGEPEETTGQIERSVSAELEREGTADFWIDLSARADLSPAYEIEDWDERGQFVYDTLMATAEESQADLRASLDDAGASYETFYASNAILVTDGDAALVQSMAQAEGVNQILGTGDFAPMPTIETVDPPSDPTAVEWNVLDVAADKVWARGFTGEGIVIASIDTGVQWDHPALKQHYRGFDAGEVNHNYNWFDATGNSPHEPVDTNGHGTHVTGILVGNAGGEQQIGVAPGARWITANGCASGCSTRNLLASGQWTLAPTNLEGKKPSVGRRPHIINNSWGSSVPSNNPLLEDVSEAWNASGQFAVFSNGNKGPECKTSTTPGSRVINYSVGNYTQSHSIHVESSRGSGQGGEIKPDISAPGTNVRSAIPGNAYGLATGTSMAAPHVAGAVALLWSARPDLRGDIEITRNLLDGSATDTNDTSCGGSSTHNNVFGQGRLNTLKLINSAPVTPIYRLDGTDRYSTAAAIADGYESGVNVVYLATGLDYPDALVGAALAGSTAGPVLLTKPDTLPAVTKAKLQQLDPDRVILLGGPDVITKDVLGQVQQLTDAQTGRVHGANRYETAVQISRSFSGSSDVVYIATGQDYPDGLAAAARSGSLNAPVLLTQPDHLPSATKQELNRLGPKRIVMLGGELAISPGVANQLKQYAASTERLSGAHRYQTAALLSKSFKNASTVYIATGEDWPDALAGAARAGRGTAPILLVQRDKIPNDTMAELQRLSPERMFVLGGPTAISFSNEIRLGRVE